MKHVTDWMSEFCKLILLEFHVIIISLDESNSETVITKDLTQDDDIADESHIQINQNNVEVAPTIVNGEHHEEKTEAEEEFVHDEQDNE